jgi:hypothetical protein
MGHIIEVREYLDAEGHSPYAKRFIDWMWSLRSRRWPGVLCGGVQSAIFSSILEDLLSMVFIACSKAENIDTMKGEMMLAWYQGA